MTQPAPAPSGGGQAPSGAGSRRSSDSPSSYPSSSWDAEARRAEAEEQRRQKERDARRRQLERIEHLSDEFLSQLAKAGGLEFDDMTAFEKLALLEGYKGGGVVGDSPTANEILQLQAHLRSQVREKAQRKQIERKNLFSAARLRISLARVLKPSAWKLLRGVKITETIDLLSQRILRKVTNAGQFVRRRWAQNVKLKNQATIAVHRDVAGGRTVVHLDSASMGTAFITIPYLPDTGVFRKVISAMRSVLGLLCGSREPIVVLNGDHQEINYKKLLPNRVILRSRSSEVKNLPDRINEVQSRSEITPENTEIIGGIPASQSQLAAVLEGDDSKAREEKARDEWDLWQGMNSAWRKSVKRAGFASNQGSDPKEAALEALQSKQNVIIIYAHSDGERIFFPLPEPDGSVLSGADLEPVKQQISTAKPIVYLLCCRTGQASDVSRFARRLLEVGAAGVVAPQTDIQAHRSHRFFKLLLKIGRSLGPLLALRKAERRSRYRELETWIG